MSKRDDILNATIGIIAEEGVMNATIGNILKKAGTGYGTLYNYFDSKEDLYLTLYVDIIRGIDSYIRSQLLECTDLESSLRLTLKYFIQYCLNHSTEFYALEALRYVPEICQGAKKLNVTEVGMFELVSMCEAEGIFKKRDPFYNTNILTGMIAVFVKFYFQSDCDVTEEKITDVIDSCINALQ